MDNVAPTTTRRKVIAHTPTQDDQMKRLSEALHRRPMTMLMAAKATGIERANICRYVATMRKADQVAVTSVKPCELTKHAAGYYTTDRSLFPVKTQLELWKTF